MQGISVLLFLVRLRRKFPEVLDNLVWDPKAWQSEHGSSKRRVLQYITMKRGASNAVLIVNFRDANMQNLDQPQTSQKIFPRSFQQILNLEINQPP